MKERLSTLYDFRIVGGMPRKFPGGPLSRGEKALVDAGFAEVVGRDGALRITRQGVEELRRLEREEAQT